MYYELYMDVFFLENFMMDYLILFTAGKILHCTATQWRIFLGAAFGSLLTCLGILLPEKNICYAVFKWTWLYIGAGAGMVLIGLKIKKVRGFLKAMAVLGISGILFGGAMGLMKPYFRRSLSLFLVLSVCSYQLVRGGLALLDYLRYIREYRCEATLYRNETVYKVNALIDTGNRLREPVTGKPIHIVSKDFAGKCWGKQPPGKIRYVPFTSVGQKDGLLPVIELDRMYIQGKKAFWVENPLVGISQEKLSEHGDYEIILNSEIF